MYRAVFIDLDGTLLKTDHSVSPFNISVINRLKQKNVMVVLVSARPLSGILPIHKKLGLSGEPIASLNGAYIFKNPRIIFNSVLNIGTAKLVNDHLKNYDAIPIYYQQENWFTELRNPAVDKEQKITSVPITVQPFNTTLQGWEIGNTGPNKILVIADPDVVSLLQETLRLKFPGLLNISTSKPTFLEIMDSKSSKLNAVKLLMDVNNIDQSEIIAIGDNYNDVGMIEFAGLGVAMGNAPNEVKAASKYVTKTNDEDGVAHAVSAFIDLN